jgi:hypothetical protein
MFTLQNYFQISNFNLVYCTVVAEINVAQHLYIDVVCSFHVDVDYVEQWNKIWSVQ